MKSFKTILGVTTQNFRKWSTDYRIWIIGILLLLLIHENVSSLADISEKIGVESSPWIYPFLYSQFHLKLVFSFPIIMIFCNAPFMDKNQIFVVARAGRLKWTIGQLLYMLIATAFYYAFIIFITFLFSIPTADFSFEWGNFFYSIEGTSIAEQTGHSFIEIQKNTLIYFTPLQATGFTFLMSWLCGVMSALIIYLSNILTKTKYLGSVIVVFLIVFSSFTGNYKEIWIKYSPFSWITLEKIDVGNLTKYPSFSYCITVYLSVIFILTITIIFISKKSDTIGN